MTIRKMTTIHHLEELGLKSETLRLLKVANVKAQELVAAVRNDVVWQSYLPDRSRTPEANQLMRYPGIGEVRAKGIIAAVDKAGFILHESEASRSARHLLVCVLGSPTVLLEHYEDLEDMAPEALMSVGVLVRETLPEQEFRVIELRFGFKDGQPLSLDGCALRFHCSTERVRQLEAKALARLRHPSRRARLEVAACYSRKALSERLVTLDSEIGKHKLEIDTLRNNSPFPEFRTELAGAPVEDLDLSESRKHLRV